MKRADFEGKYHATFSLGDLCLTSIQLERNGLRSFSGVLDWVGSPKLSTVNELLRNRFDGFMERNNLKCIGNAGEKLYLVEETKYKIYSNHDFYVAQNDPELLESYPEVKTKYDRRVERFLEKADSGNRLLFVRVGGTYEEVKELQEVLSDLVKGDFSLLFINPGPVTAVEENDWPLEQVFSVNVPLFEEPWEDSDPLWKDLLAGIELED